MTQEKTDVRESLRESVEALATTLVLGGGDDPGWASSVETSLAAISACARKADWADGARIAGELSAALHSGGTGMLERLESGTTDLQRLLQQVGTPDERPAAPSLGQDPELISDFVVESREHLNSLEAQLLILEQDPQQVDAVHSVFRSFHTIKGLAGFLELAEVQAVAHTVETLLDLARNQKLTITSAVIDVVLASADYLARWLNCLQARLDGVEMPDPAGPGALLDRVRALMESPDQAAPAAVKAQTAAPSTESNAAARVADRTVKVDTSKLDYLVDMVGELVIAQSLVRHDPDVAAKQDSRLNRNLAQMGRITDEVQKSAMSMRMVTVVRLFQKMARLVRDLSRKSSKLIEFETVGEETELDRNIVEELADPLMHMVRNAVDHGIETTDERLKTDKQAAARVRLKASHQSGQILIEVSDDGRGLDTERILRKAKDKGLLPEDAQPPESEIFNLIFQPGFSTAKSVTDVSGRGVGMDVVRKHIQKLRGRVEIQSTQGKGTTFLIKLPLTLAIIDGLVVGVGGERYIVPIYAVREMLRPAEEQITTVESRGEAVMVRDHLLPLVRLHALFGVTPRSTEPWESLLIVAEAEDRLFCVMVDELIGKQEVVIKSLGETFGNVPGIAGGAILGDGRVGLILDVTGLLCRRELAA